MPPKRTLAEVNAEFEGKEAAFQQQAGLLRRELEAVEAEILTANELSRALSIQLAAEEQRTAQWSAHADAVDSAADGELGALRRRRKTADGETALQSREFAGAAWDALEAAEAVDIVDASLAELKLKHGRARAAVTGEAYADAEFDSPRKERDATATRPHTGAAVGPRSGSPEMDLQSALHTSQLSRGGGYVSSAGVVLDDGVVVYDGSAAAASSGDLDGAPPRPDSPATRQRKLTRAEVDRVAATAAKHASRAVDVASLESAIDELQRQLANVAPQPRHHTKAARLPDAGRRCLILGCPSLPSSTSAMQAVTFWNTAFDAIGALHQSAANVHGFRCSLLGPSASACAAAPGRANTGAIDTFRDAAETIGGALSASASGAVSVTPAVVVVIARIADGWSPERAAVEDVKLVVDAVVPSSLPPAAAGAGVQLRGGVAGLLKDWSNHPGDNDTDGREGGPSSPVTPSSATLSLSELYALCIAQHIANPNVLLAVDAYWRPEAPSSDADDGVAPVTDAELEVDAAPTVARPSASPRVAAGYGISMLASTRCPSEPSVWVHATGADATPHLPLLTALTASLLSSSAPRDAGEMTSTSVGSSASQYTQDFDASTASAVDAVSTDDVLTDVAARMKPAPSSKATAVRAFEAAAASFERTPGMEPRNFAAAPSAIGLKVQHDAGAPIGGDADDQTPTIVLVPRARSLAAAIAHGDGGLALSPSAVVARRRPLTWRPQRHQPHGGSNPCNNASETAATCRVAIAAQTWWEHAHTLAADVAAVDFDAVRVLEQPDGSLAIEQPAPDRWAAAAQLAGRLLKAEGGALEMQLQSAIKAAAITDATTATPMTPTVRLTERAAPGVTPQELERSRVRLRCSVELRRRHQDESGTPDDDDAAAASMDIEATPDPRPDAAATASAGGPEAAENGDVGAGSTTPNTDGKNDRPEEGLATDVINDGDTAATGGEGGSAGDGEDAAPPSQQPKSRHDDRDPSSAEPEPTASVVDALFGSLVDHCFADAYDSAQPVTSASPLRIRRAAKVLPAECVFNLALSRVTSTTDGERYDMCVDFADGLSLCAFFAHVALRNAVQSATSEGAAKVELTNLQLDVPCEVSLDVEGSLPGDRAGAVFLRRLMLRNSARLGRDATLTALEVVPACVAAPDVLHAHSASAAATRDFFGVAADAPRWRRHLTRHDLSALAGTVQHRRLCALWVAVRIVGHSRRDVAAERATRSCMSALFAAATRHQVQCQHAHGHFGSCSSIRHAVAEATYDADTSKLYVCDAMRLGVSAGLLLHLEVAAKGAADSARCGATIGQCLPVVVAAAGSPAGPRGVASAVVLDATSDADWLARADGCLRQAAQSNSAVEGPSL